MAWSHWLCLDASEYEKGASGTVPVTTRKDCGKGYLTVPSVSYLGFTILFWDRVVIWWRRGSGSAAAAALAKDGEGGGTGSVLEEMERDLLSGEGDMVSAMGNSSNEQAWKEEFCEDECSDDVVWFKLEWGVSFDGRDDKGEWKIDCWAPQWTEASDLCGWLAKGKVCSSKITCRETKILPVEILRHLNPRCTLLKPRKTHCLDLKSSLWRLNGQRKGKHARPNIFKEEKSGAWWWSFSKGDILSEEVGSRLMRYVAIRKTSFQYAWGTLLWDKRERPVSTMWRCFHSTNPFCWDAWGQVTRCWIPIDAK